jgi:hypothetical protein
MVSCPQASPPTPCAHLSPLPYTPHAQPISFFLIHLVLLHIKTKFKAVRKRWLCSSYRPYEYSTCYVQMYAPKLKKLLLVETDHNKQTSTRLHLCLFLNPLRKSLKYQASRCPNAPLLYPFNSAFPPTESSPIKSTQFQELFSTL